MADATDLIDLSTPVGNSGVNGVKVGETLTGFNCFGGTTQDIESAMPRRKTEICVSCNELQPAKGTLCEKCRYQKRKEYHARRYRELGGYRGWKSRYPHIKGADRNVTHPGVYKNINLLRRRFSSCQLCGFDSEPRILEVHHKDRNRTNNELSNLLLVCPNCHALEHLKLRGCKRSELLMATPS